MFGIGFQEMLLILVVVLIFFGPKRLPDLAKSLGKGLAEFKKASEEVKKNIDEAMKEEAPKEEAAKEETAKEETTPRPPVSQG
jgi:sec-independent protein translocase protein TatA